ncbi:MAG: acylneuraminate cytidylyltransferase family protein [Eubacterium sp.]|nr:acylneuraminate cytidylyltransferase family protein [Eubacterium sp.]
MIEGKKAIAIIPARGGSKGIPGKNVVDVAGRPLIAYTIAAATNCDEIDRVVVSTDDTDIAGIAIREGAEVPWLRPAELASDTSKTIDAVIYTLERIRSEEGEKYDLLVLLQPTSPLRREVDIKVAIRAAVDTGEDVVTISEINDPPVLMREYEEISDGVGRVKNYIDTSSTIRRQDMKKMYRVNGAVYVNHVDRLSLDTSLNDNPVGVLMPKERSIDVDDETDLFMVRALITSE